MMTTTGGERIDRRRHHVVQHHDGQHDNRRLGAETAERRKTTKRVRDAHRFTNPVRRWKSLT